MYCERLKEYFSFTRKERIGVAVLIFLILLIFILPVFFTPSSGITDLQTLNQLTKEIASQETNQQDDSSSSNNFYSQEEDKNDASDREDQQRKRNSKEGFFFDPNSASTKEWKQLGIKEKTIHTIQHYLARGGRFKKAEDLQKIYGMREDDYQRLISYVRIKNSDRVDSTSEVSDFSFKKNDRVDSNNKSVFLAKIDINTADSSAFIALKGIGITRASRIIRFREKLGGFYSIDQIGETYGLPDSVFQQIKSKLVIISDSVRKIDINEAGLEDFRQHPYFGWTIAKAIVEYRTQHGSFKSLEELLKIDIISPERFRKFAPYLTIKKQDMSSGP